MSTQIYIYTIVCLYICIYIYTYIGEARNLYPLLKVYTYIYIHMHICIYICIHTFSGEARNLYPSLTELDMGSNEMTGNHFNRYHFAHTCYLQSNRFFFNFMYYIYMTWVRMKGNFLNK